MLNWTHLAQNSLLSCLTSQVLIFFCLTTQVGRLNFTFLTCECKNLLKNCIASNKIIFSWSTNVGIKNSPKINFTTKSQPKLDFSTSAVSCEFNKLAENFTLLLNNITFPSYNTNLGFNEFVKQLFHNLPHNSSAWYFFEVQVWAEKQQFSTRF